jgi:protein SCO1
MNPTSTDSPPRILRWKRTLAPVLFVLALIGMISAILLPVPSFLRSKSKPGVEVFTRPLPEFRLTERSGQSVSKADLLGKVWVAGFVFTRCNGPCPSVTATMARLQTELNLAASDDLRLVTFTVDPGRDGPEELKKYATKFAAHPERWLFLTGQEAEIHTLMKTGFMMGVQRSEKAEPIEGQEFDHSTFLVVVDKTGNIRGHFDGYQGPNDENGERFQERFAAMKAMIAELRR